MLNEGLHTVVTVATPPAAEPVTLAEMRTALRLDGTEDDVLIESTLIPAARRAVERETGRTLITTALQLACERFPPGSILLPRPPLQAAAQIVYVDTAGVSRTLTVAAAQYQVNTRATPGWVEPPYGGSWPATREVPNAVVVSYGAGYGLTAATILAKDPELVYAVRELVRAMYEDGWPPDAGLPKSVARLINNLIVR